MCYATFFGWPDNKQVLVKTLASGSQQLAGTPITQVSLLGHEGKLEWKQGTDGLTVQLPAIKPCELAFVLKMDGISK